MLLIHAIILFFNVTATTEIYTLSLHDALPISRRPLQLAPGLGRVGLERVHLRRPYEAWIHGDRKSTRLNSSHANISYAVFCLKKKSTQREMLGDKVIIVLGLSLSPRSRCVDVE